MRIVLDANVIQSALPFAGSKRDRIYERVQ